MDLSQNICSGPAFHHMSQLPTPNSSLLGYGRSTETKHAVFEPPAGRHDGQNPSVDCSAIRRSEKDWLANPISNATPM